MKDNRKYITGFPPFKEHKIQGLFQDLLTHIQERKCAKNICFKINVCFIMLLIMLNSPVTFRSIVRPSWVSNTLCFKSVILAWLNLSVSQQQENSRTFKDLLLLFKDFPGLEFYFSNSRTFQDLYCFSRTFQALNFIFQIQGLSRTVGTLTLRSHCQPR